MSNWELPVSLAFLHSRDTIFIAFRGLKAGNGPPNLFFNTSQLHHAIGRDVVKPSMHTLCCLQNSGIYKAPFPCMAPSLCLFFTAQNSKWKQVKELQDCE